MVLRPLIFSILIPPYILQFRGNCHRSINDALDGQRSRETHLLSSLWAQSGSIPNVFGAQNVSIPTIDGLSLIFTGFEGRSFQSRKLIRSAAQDDRNVIRLTSRYSAGNRTAAGSAYNTGCLIFRQT